MQMILPDSQAEVKTMPAQTSSITRAKREAALQEAKKGYARAIEADKPQHILNYWRQKVDAIQWLLNGEEE